MQLSVVVACFNEHGSILRFERELAPALDALGVDYEVIAVDDGSTDATPAALKNLAAKWPRLRFLTHDKNRGLGAALRAGFALAAGDWILTLDADLTFSPSKIKDLLAAQKETGADLVSGSPFLAGAEPEKPRWTRRLPSLILNAFYRGLYEHRFTSYTPIFRLYRSAILRALPLSSEGFEINAEIAARFIMAGRKLAEIPAKLSTRAEGVSKLKRWRELKRHARLIAQLQAERAFKTTR